jgi:hypothetical protein
MKRILILLLVVISLAGLTAAVRAQSGAGYDLSWWTIDAGGGMNFTGGSYALSATAGQQDAATASGSGYSFLGGFWGLGDSGGTGSLSFKVYLPTILR